MMSERVSPILARCENSFTFETTHRQLTDAQKVQAGAGPDVVRLSIGLEDKEDIIADLEQGLAAA